MTQLQKQTLTTAQNTQNNKMQKHCVLNVCYRHLKHSVFTNIWIKNNHICLLIKMISPRNIELPPW